MECAICKVDEAPQQDHHRSDSNIIPLLRPTTPPSSTSIAAASIVFAAIDPHLNAAMTIITSIRSSSASSLNNAACTDSCLDHLCRLWTSSSSNIHACDIKRAWTITLVLLREFEHDGYLSFQQSREHTILETSTQWRVARSSASLWHMILHACQSCQPCAVVCDTDICHMMASLLYYDVAWSSPDEQSKGLDSILQFAIEEKASDTVIQWLCSAGANPYEADQPFNVACTSPEPDTPGRRYNNEIKPITTRAIASSSITKEWRQSLARGQRVDWYDDVEDEAYGVVIIQAIRDGDDVASDPLTLDPPLCCDRFRLYSTQMDRWVTRSCTDILPYTSMSLIGPFSQSSIRGATPHERGRTISGELKDRPRPFYSDAIRPSLAAAMERGYDEHLANRARCTTMIELATTSHDDTSRLLRPLIDVVMSYIDRIQPATLSTAC